MTSEEIRTSLEHQIALLKKEKAADYALYEERMMNTEIKERVKNGVTWYPIRIEKDFISTGERITLEISRSSEKEQKHAFQVGGVVSIFSGTEEKDKTLSGVVSYLRDSNMRIVLNQSYLPEWVNEDKLGVNLLFDDGTYREMNRSLHQVLNATNDRLAELRDILYGLKSASFTKGHSYDLPSLNEVQNQAFDRIVHANDVAFVHGPPGTGKTTTLIKCIKETIRQEKQVLVCAPSNAAVDLLVERLIDEELNVLRLGHPARLTPDVVENSLDVRISKHPDFQRLKEMRRQSEEYRAMAGKYKRNFGREEKKQRDLLYKEARTLKNESRHLENYISDNLVDKAEVIACTLTGSSHSLIQDRIFKTVFIDESSQALEAAAWIPIIRSQRVIMSGDHFQLPPTIKSLKAAKDGLEHTLFARGLEAQPEGVVMLQTQYRMHPKIMGFSSQQFYKGKLKAAPSVLSRENRFDPAIRFIDTAGAGYDERIKKETLSTYNEEEAVFLIRLMQADNLKGLKVGIIAPYKAQVEILNRLVNQSVSLAQFRENIDINSVDAFQGQERDTIYISLVRSNPNGEIGFLKEYRRLNVAMTRAKEQLVLVGDSATLGSDYFFNKMLEYVLEQGGYKSIYELTELMEG
ncbi:AAA domain-containing protein [Ekhidna sp.]|uniref:AAA domain-containing protein n=1 Tax=Ekhidna sp. TaxID=2608089 RepID=UPI003298F72A